MASGSVDGKALCGAPGMVMPPFCSDRWFTSRRVNPKRAWLSVVGETVQSYSEANRRNFRGGRDWLAEWFVQQGAGGVS